MLHRFLDLPFVRTGAFYYQLDLNQNASPFDEWSQIWKVPFGGGTPTAVTTNSTPNVFHQIPKPSPDGTQVVFDNFNSNTNVHSLTICDTSGGGQATLDTATGGLSIWFIQWHPDGSKILYQKGNGTGATINTIQPDGSNQTVVATVNDLRTPSYNSDGTKIVYAVDAGVGTRSIHVADADGTNDVTIVSSGSAGLRQPVWLQTTDHIVYAISFHQVWRIAADGTGDTRIDSGGTALSFPFWSPECVISDDSKVMLIQTTGGASPWYLWSIDPWSAGSQASVSPTLQVFANINEVGPRYADGRVYVDKFLLGFKMDVVSVLPGGSNERTEHDINDTGTGTYYETAFLSEYE